MFPAQVFLQSLALQMEHQRLQAERNRLHGTWLSGRLTYLRWLFFTSTKDFKTWAVAGCIHLTLKLPEDMKRRSEFQMQRTADFNEVFVWNEKRCNAKAISKLRTAHETELKQTKVRQDNQDRDIEMAPLPLMLCKKYAKSQSRFISFHAFSVFVVTRGSRMEQDQSQQHKMEWEGRHQVQYLVYQCVLWYLCYCLRFLHNPCHFHFLWKQVQILCDLCNCGSLFYKNLKGSESSLEEPNKKRKMNAERKIVHKPTGSQLLDNLLWAQSGSNSSLACIDSKHFVATSRCISWLSEEVLQLQVQSIQAQCPMFWTRKWFSVFTVRDHFCVPVSAQQRPGITGRRTSQANIWVHFQCCGLLRTFQSERTHSDHFAFSTCKASKLAIWEWALDIWYQHPQATASQSLNVKARKAILKVFDDRSDSLGLFRCLCWQGNWSKKRKKLKKICEKHSTSSNSTAFVFTCERWKVQPQGAKSKKFGLQHKRTFKRSFWFLLLVFEMGSSCELSIEAFWIENSSKATGRQGAAGKL